MKKISLREMFVRGAKRGIIDYSVRCTLDGQGNPVFYIHPSSASGDTLDFIVRHGNVLEQLNAIEAPQAQTQFVAPDTDA